MPYCHNAIIFKYNKLKYSNKYSICSDYDYFIRFVRKESIDIFNRKNYNNEINIYLKQKMG